MLQLLGHGLMLCPFVLLLVEQEEVVLVGCVQVVLGVKRTMMVLGLFLGLRPGVGGRFSFVDGFVFVPAFICSFVHC